MKYRSKSLVEAKQWLGTNLKEMEKFVPGVQFFNTKLTSCSLHIPGLKIAVLKNNWIVKEHGGAPFVYPEGLFIRNYETVPSYRFTEDYRRISSG